jgi:hypothetical protein
VGRDTVAKGPREQQRRHHGPAATARPSCQGRGGKRERRGRRGRKKGEEVEEEAKEEAKGEESKGEESEGEEAKGVVWFSLNLVQRPQTN